MKLATLPLILIFFFVAQDFPVIALRKNSQVIFSLLNQSDFSESSHPLRKIYFQAEYWLFENEASPMANFSGATIKVEKEGISFFESLISSIKLKPTYKASYNKIVGIGDILVPTFQEFYKYISDPKERNGVYYGEYFEKFEGYLELFKKVVKNVMSLEFCRVLQERMGNMKNFIYANARLFIVCFPYKGEMNEFLKEFTQKYILALTIISPIQLLPLEQGRALDVFYDRFQYKDVQHLFSMRVLENAIALYNYQSDLKKNCLQEAIPFDEIYECKIDYWALRRLDEIKNFPNISCCISFNRTMSGEIYEVEYLCSSKNTVETCVYDARVMQRTIGEKCARFFQKTQRNVTSLDVFQEFLGEDRKIKAEVELEPRERGNIDCCLCSRENQNS